MSKTSTTHHKGDNGKSYKTVTDTYGNGASKSVTYEKSSTVYGSDKVVNVTKRNP